MSCIVVHKTNLSKPGLGIFQYGPQIHRSPEQNDPGHKYLVQVWGMKKEKCGPSGKKAYHPGTASNQFSNKYPGVVEP